MGYLVAVVVTSWQLGQVSEFMINTYCDSLNEMFGQWLLFGIIEEVDAQCFRLDVNVVAGSYWLILASVLLSLLNTFVLRASRQFFRETAIKGYTGQFAIGKQKLSTTE